MKTILKMTVLSATAILVAGCDDFGPYQAQLQPSTSFSLANKSGNYTSFDGSKVYDVYVGLNGSNKSVLMRSGDDQFEFKNGTWDQRANSINSSFDVSGVRTQDGQRVGISFSRKIICDPNCSETREYETTVSCSYTTSRREWVCDGGRGHNCYERWVEEIVYGSQRVRRTETVTRYDLAGDIVAERIGHLAQATGLDRVVSVSDRPLESCR
jgi:hypothetical protein